MVLFLVGFTVMVWLGERLPAGARNEFYVAQRGVRLDDSWRPTRVGGQHEIYAGTGGFIDGARQADVLLLGNSRTMLAFRHPQIRVLAERTGKRFFNLGFGFNATYGFTLEVIRAHDLRPEWIVVNVDDFLVSGVSAPAREAMAEAETASGALAGWRRAKAAFENRLVLRIKARLQPWLPRWGGVLPSGGEALRHHRSNVDGAWLSSGFDAIDHREPIPSSPVGPSETYRLRDDEVRAVREFRDEMARRDVDVIAILIPHPGVSRSRAASVAAALGAPLVAPLPPGLTTFDGSHLDGESARRFVEAFAAEIETLPAFTR